MKRFLLIAILALTGTTSHAALGRHNFQINVGGGYQAIIKPQTFSLFGASEGYTGHGGIVSAELGYLFHSVRESGIIHGFDLRVEGGVSLYKKTTVLSNLAGSVFQDLNQGFFGFAMTYTVGRQLQSGRLMFDAVGYGLLGRFSSISRYSDAIPLTSSVEHSGMTMQYVLPGVQFLHNNGFTFGWRNKFKLFLGGLEGEGMFAFDTTVSIGYTFGGGKQPWEK